jgi:hypothetical protein
MERNISNIKITEDYLFYVAEEEGRSENRIS